MKLHNPLGGFVSVSGSAGAESASSLARGSVASESDTVPSSLSESESGSIEDENAESGADDFCAGLSGSLPAAGSDDDQNAESAADEVCAGLSGSFAARGSVEEEKAESGADDFCLLLSGASAEPGWAWVSCPSFFGSALVASALLGSALLGSA